MTDFFTDHVQVSTVKIPKSYVALGNIMLTEAGKEACESGYGTTDPEWAGRYAIEYGDINPDGTLN